MHLNIDTRTAGYGALLLRLTMGILFLLHSGLKFFVFTPEGTEKYFISLGLPGWFGIFVIFWELAAGIALILGIWPRLAALLIAPDLIGAIVVVHIHNGFFFNVPGGGWEYPEFWTIGLIAFALIGDGPYTLVQTPFNQAEAW